MKKVLCLLMLLVCGCSTVKDDYAQAKSTDTYWAYTQFLSNHPGSEFSADAALRMDEALWRVTTRGGSIEQYRNYLSKLPNGKHAKEATAKIAILEKVAQLKEKKQKAFDAEIGQVKDISELEALLTKYADSDVAGKALARIEDTMIAEIDSKGPGTRFVVKDLRPANVGPQGVGQSGRVTISVQGQSVGFQMQTPKDAIPMAGMGAVLPMGPGSVHRFDGSVAFKPYPQGGMMFVDDKEAEAAGYRFVGKGDQYHRLTFYLTKEYGYVYLRGKGEVIPKSGGETTKLGE